jgi:hypothetical protein
MIAIGGRETYDFECCWIGVHAVIGTSIARYDGELASGISIICS